VLEQATAPVVLHWLGTVFDPQLGGYFGSDDPAEGADVLLRIIERDPSKIRGVKMSLLDDAAEIAVRERLPEGVRMLTGTTSTSPTSSWATGPAPPRPTGSRWPASTPTPCSAPSPRPPPQRPPPCRRWTPGTRRRPAASSTPPW